MVPPPVRPYSAARAFVITVNSSTLSTIGVYAVVLIPTLFSGKMIDVPSMVISLVPFLPPLIHGVDAPFWLCTPGVRPTKFIGFLPFKGRSMMDLVEITVETDELPVASCVPVAVTSTVVVISPTFSAMSSPTFCSTPARTWGVRFLRL